MNIFFDEKDTVEVPEDVKEAVKKAVGAGVEKLGVPVCLNILFTDDEGIKELNAEFRGLDCATDVLSFPAYDLDAFLKDSMDKIDGEYVDGELFLGDIAISMEHAQQQAEEYGHTLIREAAFLALHGLLHLMGYDHMTQEEEKVMTDEQKSILQSVDIGRNMNGRK